MTTNITLIKSELNQDIQLRADCAGEAATTATTNVEAAAHCVTASQITPPGNWLAVSNTRPCAMCGAKRKCTYTDDGAVAKCCEKSAGAFKTTDDDVGPAYFHRLTVGTPSSLPAATPTDPAGITAEQTGGLDVVAVHEIYAAMLNSLEGIAPNHLENLTKRGLNAAQSMHNGYRSMRRDIGQMLAKNLHSRFRDNLFKVPGFSKDKHSQAKLYYPHIETASGWKPVNLVLLIPVRNSAGKIVAVKIRIDDPRWNGGKYVWLTSSKSGGPKANASVHVPKGTPAVCETVRITEGELKADVSFALDQVPVISIPGVSSYAKSLPVLRQLAAKQVLIAFDADCRTNPNVAKSLGKLYQALTEAGYAVEIEHWDIKDGKGIDDLLAGGKIPQVATGPDALAFLAEIIKSSGADLIENQGSAAKRQSPGIECTLDEQTTNDIVIKRLAQVETVFQRGGSLVHVIQEPVKCAGIVRPLNTPSIQSIPEPRLREILSNIVTFGQNDSEGEWQSIRVPSHVTKGIYNRGQWTGVRKLESVVTYPIIRADGTIASKPGYDPLTGLFLHIPADLVALPDAPGIAEARAAIEQLHAVVVDFPFQSPEHFTCWVAMLLTPLARFAFSGPTPLFVIDANTRGSGKTLLAEIFSQAVTGGDFARLAPCHDDDEFRKRITAIAMRGDPLILLDNVHGDLGGPSFDAALTSTSWTDRVLGASRQITLPLYSVWVATGNNIILAADTTRRVCHIRLSSPVERPEERTGFKYPDILAHVRENRSLLLSAALTILAAYIRAGRPRQAMKPWGSFEGWSNIVRQALIWAGEPDPAESRDELIANSDTGACLLADLLAGWEVADRDNEGMTVSQAIKKTDVYECNDRLKDAIRELCGTKKHDSPSAHSLGKHMRKFRGRVVGGKCFDCVDNGDKTKVWKVMNSGDTGDTGVI